MKLLKKLAVTLAAFFLGLFMFGIESKAYSLPPGVEVLSTTAVNAGGTYDVLSFNKFEDGGSGISGLPLYGIWQYLNDYHSDEDYILYVVPQLDNPFELYVSDVLVPMDYDIYSILISFNVVKSNTYFVFRDMYGDTLQAISADNITSAWELKRVVISDDDSFFDLLNDAYDNGKDDGFYEGYEAAGFDYDEAFAAGQLAAEDISIWGSIQNVFFGVFGLLAIEIVPGVTLGLLMFFPLILGLLFTVVSFARGFRR